MSLLKCVGGAANAVGEVAECAFELLFFLLGKRNLLPVHYLLVDFVVQPRGGFVEITHTQSADCDVAKDVLHLGFYFILHNCIFFVAHPVSRVRLFQTIGCLTVREYQGRNRLDNTFALSRLGNSVSPQSGLFPVL